MREKPTLLWTLLFLVVALAFISWLCKSQDMPNPTACSPNSDKPSNPTQALGLKWIGQLRAAPEIELMSIESGSQGAITQLGSVKLRRAEKERAINAMEKSVLESDGREAGCFNPRHCICYQKPPLCKAEICFECLQILVEEPGEENLKKILISSSAQPILDQILREHKIPLAKK